MEKGNPNGRDKPAGSTEAGAAGNAEAYARWLEHAQRARGRHSAITRHLYSWSNYKSWAEKVKGTFDPTGNK